MQVRSLPPSLMIKNKKTKALRFGKTASGTVSLSRLRSKPKPADERRLKKKETKVNRVRLNVVN